VSARKYAAAVPTPLGVGVLTGIVFFVVSLISGASLGLALALAGGGGFIVGALFAARRNPERLLPLACIAGAAALFASEFMTTFQLTSTSTAGPEFCNVEAAGRHHFALGILAIFAVLAVIIAVTAGSKPAAIAVGIAGVAALILFLTIDLPHANNTGTLGACSATAAVNFFDAKAQPEAGFWLEMVGALALALSGVALATLSPQQLRSIRPRWLGGPKEDEKPPPKRAATAPLSDLDAELTGSRNDRRETETRGTRRRTRARGGRGG
jgi:hypothetical protein